VTPAKFAERDYFKAEAPLVVMNFDAYMYIAAKARETGNDPRTLKGFLYDILREHLIKLFFVEDFDL